MKTQALVVIIAVLLASQVRAEIKTPPIDSVFNPGHDTTLADINEPEIGEGSTPNGVSVDQVFQETANDDSLLTPITAGAANDEPVVSVAGIGGRKMLSGRKMLDTLALTGDGVQAGAAGVGVTSTAAGNGNSGFFEGQGISDSHIQPHQDQVTVTAAGKSITTGAGVDPDQLGGENNDGLVYTTPGRK